MSDTKTVIDPQFIHFKLVTTQVEMMHVAAVRGICNLEEVGVPAQHEFDDNDNFATHALGYCHDEPISAVRMRFFGDFVKLERACVRPRYRNRHILPRAIDLVSRFAGQKGYRHIVTHAKPTTARLWRLLGFEISDKAPTEFEGHEQGYLELIKDIPLRNDAVSLHRARSCSGRKTASTSPIPTRSPHDRPECENPQPGRRQGGTAGAAARRADGGGGEDDQW